MPKIVLTILACLTLATATFAGEIPPASQKPTDPPKAEVKTPPAAPKPAAKAPAKPADAPADAPKPPTMKELTAERDKLAAEAGHCRQELSQAKQTAIMVGIRLTNAAAALNGIAGAN